MEPQSSNSQIPQQNLPQPHRVSRKRFFLIGGVLFIVALTVLIGRVTLTFERVSKGKGVVFENEEDAGFTPHKDSDRVNVLLMGLRGVDDPEGGLLTDAMTVASLKKSTKEAALISIPRDVWVRMPGKKTYDKINAAYALGFEEGGSASALAYAKAVAEKVTGLSLDGAVSVDIQALRDFIDAVGGITLTLERPFTENRQWVRGGDMGTSTAFIIETYTVTSADGIATETAKWVFELPKGTQVLNGTTALYYIRARFSSNDFDRARREQQVLVALGTKLKSRGTLLNPFALNELLKAFERNVETDMSPKRILELASFASGIAARTVQKIILSDDETGLLQTKHQNGVYTLVPRTGNFEEIRKMSREVFAEK